MKKDIYERFKNSYFGVNKVYLFLIFIGLSIGDITLGILYFFLSGLIFIRKTLRAKLPIETGKDFKMITKTYKELEDTNLKVDIWYPNEIKEKYPLIYFCHGGGWVSGFRNQPNNISWCKYLANKGFIVASIDYRYGYTHSMTDILSDYIDGIEFLRDNSKSLKIDSNNISLVGLSAGGHLALLFATYFTSLENIKMMKGINSVVGYYPPTNLRDITVEEHNKSFFASLAIKRTLKNTPEDIIDGFSYYSPINYVSDKMIPTFIAHGKEDNTVPISSSIKFIDKLKLYNVPYKFMVHNNADHSFDTTENDYRTVKILEETSRFLKKYVDK